MGGWHARDLLADDRVSHDSARRGALKFLLLVLERYEERCRHDTQQRNNVAVGMDDGGLGRKASQSVGVARQRRRRRRRRRWAGSLSHRMDISRDIQAVEKGCAGRAEGSWSRRERCHDGWVEERSRLLGSSCHQRGHGSEGKSPAQSSWSAIRAPEKSLRCAALRCGASARRPSQPASQPAPAPAPVVLSLVRSACSLSPQYLLFFPLSLSSLPPPSTVHHPPRAPTHTPRSLSLPRASRVPCALSLLLLLLLLLLPKLYLHQRRHKPFHLTPVFDSAIRLTDSFATAALRILRHRCKVGPAPSAS
ncbi:hypothetical protein BKA81DRAFT_109815 [Phyllosticta paracitricarpa]